MISYSTDPRDIRKFGVIAFVLFGCLCALGIWREKIVPAGLFGLLSVTGLALILLPVRLKGLYAGWMKIAGFIGMIVNTVALALAYYVIITPIALLIRIFRGPFFPMGPDRHQPSYWVTRDEPVQPRERFPKRY